MGENGAVFVSTTFLHVTVQGYVQEDGTGAFQLFRVPDLVHASGSPVELLILLESPHADEIKYGLPLAGKAGRDALRFLATPTIAAEPLGQFVDALQRDGDGRLAIMNVSEVPLQRGAFDPCSRPPLSRADWELLRKVRNRGAERVDGIRDPEIRTASAHLLPHLQKRVGAVALSPSATVVIAGKFAQRYWNSIDPAPAASVLPVPHPSFDQWNRSSNSTNPNLVELRRLFAMHST